MEHFDQFKAVRGLAQNQIVAAFPVIAQPPRIATSLQEPPTGLGPWWLTGRKRLKPGDQ